jgi:hypothetical protein
MKRILTCTLVVTFLIAPNFIPEKAHADWRDWWPFSVLEKPPVSENLPKTQVGVIQQIQDNIIHTLSQFIEYETIEVAALSTLKKSENYIACANKSPESCEAFLTDLEIRSQNYIRTHQKVWQAFEESEVRLMNQYVQLPPQIQADLQGEILYYFQTAYLKRLKVAYAAVDEVTKQQLPTACAEKNQSCSDFHLGIDSVTYRNLIDLHNAALQSLQSGSDDFMPNGTAI